MEETIGTGLNKFSMTIKKNAKGEVYGDFTVKGDTAEELKANLDEAKTLFLHEVGNY